MDHLFIEGNIEGDATANGLIQKLAANLMTPDMQAAGAAGCRFEVIAEQKGESIKITLRTLERVSILRMPDGTPFSVLKER